MIQQSRLHLRSVNETGREHMVKALGYALTLQSLVPVLIIHSLIPSLFTSTASNTMKGILDDRCCSDNEDNQMEFDFDAN